VVTIQPSDLEGAQRANALRNPDLPPKEREKLVRELGQAKPADPGIHANYKRVDKTPLKIDVPASGFVQFNLNKDGT
jgi:hypothetical protein